MNASLGFSVLFGIGVFLMYASFHFPRYWFKRLVNRVDGTGAQWVTLAEANLLQAILADISRLIAPEPKDLVDRLRVSGWVYPNPAAYHMRRTVDALLCFLSGVTWGVVLTMFFQFPLLAVLVLISLLTAAGFFQPDLRLKAAITERKERLLREMGFGLERIALFLQSGEEVSDALGRCQSLGMFGSVAAQLSLALKLHEFNFRRRGKSTAGIPALSTL